MAKVKIDMPERFLFSATIPVRIGDINYGGHVGNDAIVSIIHESRLQFLSSMGCTELEFFGTGLIMADLVVTYKGEAFYGDVVTVEVTPGEISSVSFDLFYRISTQRNGQPLLITEAKTGMVCFDYTSRKIARLPEAFKEKINL